MDGWMDGWMDGSTHVDIKGPILPHIWPTIYFIKLWDSVAGTLFDPVYILFEAIKAALMWRKEKRDCYDRNKQTIAF